MRRVIQETVAAIGASAFPLLLLALVFILTVVPLLEGYGKHGLLLDAALTAVFLTGVSAVRRRTVWFIVGIAVAAVAVPMTWTTFFIDYKWLFVANCLLASSFFAVTAGLILWMVLRHHFATIHSVLGAACVYLLLGLSWAMVYWAIDRVNVDALVIPSPLILDETREGRPVTAFSELVYFSFVTMSTLGYGDITPTTSLARTATWMQSVAGQFYVAVFVAWLVGALPRPQRRVAGSDGGA